MTDNVSVEPGSDNVFADLGFDNPEEELLKAKLVREIRAVIKRRRLTQAKAAILMGVRQPDVSAIVTGRTGKYSLDRLVRCLNRLGYSIDMVVRKKRRPRTAAAAASRRFPSHKGGGNAEAAFSNFKQRVAQYRREPPFLAETAPSARRRQVAARLLRSASPLRATATFRRGKETWRAKA